MLSIPKTKTIFLFFSVFIIAAVSISSAIFSRVQAQSSGSPPVISNVLIDQIEENKAHIKWETDKESSSLINYGLDRNYGLVRDPGSKKEHELVIGNLDPGTRYFFRVVSVDQFGNQSVSAGYSFTTAGEKPVAQDIQEMIDQITDPDELREVSEMIREAARDIIEEIFIVSDPHVFPESESAVITWQTSRPANSRVSFSPADNFQEGGSYQFSQGNDEFTTDHEVEIIGLSPFTEYHFRVSSEDEVGLSANSEDATFRTRAVVPTIQSFNLATVGETSAAFELSSAIPTSAFIEFENIETGEVRTSGSPTFSSNHQIRLTGLEFGGRYRATAFVENEEGEGDQSNPIEFRTEINEDPPIISNVSNESTLFPGAESRVQTIISWDTSEPAVCRLSFQQGLAPGAEFEELEPREKSFLESHVQVVVEFRPATVYKFWINCVDRIDNEGRSEDFVLFTPQQEKSIIDIIIENFEATFGWLKDIGGN